MARTRTLTTLCRSKTTAPTPTGTFRFCAVHVMEGKRVTNNDAKATREAPPGGVGAVDKTMIDGKPHAASARISAGFH